MKVGRKEQRKINCKAKSEMKKFMEGDHKERQKDGENPYGKLKKDVEHEKCERVEKIDILIIIDCSLTLPAFVWDNMVVCPNSWQTL